jgi:hypothetical protein
MTGEWISVSERLPEIATEGVSVTVIAAHVGYDLTMQGFVRTGGLRSSPADYIGSDETGPWFKSMVNGRRLDVAAWMPLPEPPEVKGAVGAASEVRREARKLKRLRMTRAEREAIAYYIGTGGPQAVDDALSRLLQRHAPRRRGRANHK